MTEQPASDPATAPRRVVVTFGAERAKAFADAVVAIAMTLLILPLMESVTDLASQGGGAIEWLHEHGNQLQSFVLSFVVIAMFWIDHHRMFARVERVTNVLVWIMMAWLLSIVWLPVPTAMSGAMPSTDRVVTSLYIGTMMLASLLILAQRLYLRQHDDLHGILPLSLRRGLAVDIAMFVLFGVALLIAVVFPSLGYSPLFLMFLVGPLQGGVARLLGHGSPGDGPAPSPSS